MVNWNIYNDNTMTSDVSYLKNSRSSLIRLNIHRPRMRDSFCEIRIHSQHNTYRKTWGINLAGG